jgi:hypothetical protein
MTPIHDPRFCACCEAPSPRVLEELWNRPGLSALAYRIGTFATFRESMLEDIVKEAALAALATRESDDYAITLIELFAAVGDILTFYNERIANELYLRSAQERDSVLRLVRLIGYRLQPGLAANAMLAFTLDDGELTRIRKGLKVMSVPGQDERPQNFETLEVIQADARLNALPVYAPFQPFNAFRPGEREAPVLQRPDPLNLGDRVLIFGGSTLEEKTVEALEQARDGERLRFAPAVQAAGLPPGVARVAKLVRRLRFFGHNAPDTHPYYDLDPTVPPQRRWRLLHTVVRFGAARTRYPLDTRYDDLKPGAQLLVDAGPGVIPRLRMAVVTETEEAPAQMMGRESPASPAVPIPGLEGTVTYVTLNQALGVLADRRETRIYEIVTPDIEFREYDYPKEITGGRVVARLADAPDLSGLDKGRRILLDDGTTRHLAEVTATALIASTPGGALDHLRIDFSPLPPKPLGQATLQGNIAKASHGETQPEEPLGNGDATQAFATFVLRRSPLTYLQSASQITGQAELEIRINGEQWQEAPSLYGRKPNERIYTARQNGQGQTEITFGDGRTGARTPTGAMNIVARYRTGLGLEGRMRADQLSIPLERPVGLRAVTNPLPADGGADPERRDDARQAAPGTVQTFGRAVSLQDFKALATTSGLVARAHATWVWYKLEKAVHLTVAAAGGAALSTDSLKTLYEALTTARDPNRPLLLANLVRVPLVVRAKLLREPAFETDAVLEAARAALTAHFAFEAMALGRSVHASDIYAVLQGARGVLAVDLDVFHLKGYAVLSAEERAVRAVTSAPAQDHVRIFPARPTPPDPSLIDRFASAAFTGPSPPPVLAAEQAYIEDPVADIDLSVVEAF